MEEINACPFFRGGVLSWMRITGKLVVKYDNVFKRRVRELCKNNDKEWEYAGYETDHQRG